MSHAGKLPVFIFIGNDLKAVTASVILGNDALCGETAEEEQLNEWEDTPKDVIWKTPHLHDTKALKRGGWAAAVDEV